MHARASKVWNTPARGEVGPGRQAASGVNQTSSVLVRSPGGVSADAGGPPP
jgi:hypothetical protein